MTFQIGRRWCASCDRTYRVVYAAAWNPATVTLPCPVCGTPTTPTVGDDENKLQKPLDSAPGEA